MAVIETPEELVFLNASGPLMSCSRNDATVKRYLGAVLLGQGLAKSDDLAAVQGIHRSTLFRNQKLYREGGLEAIRNGRGRGAPRRAHKLTDEVLPNAQTCLDQGRSQAPPGSIRRGLAKRQAGMDRRGGRQACIRCFQHSKAWPRRIGRAVGWVEPQAKPICRNCRTCRVPIGTCFFTVNLVDRRRALLIENIDRLRCAFREMLRAHPFKISAVVVMPEHIHCLWEMPDGDSDSSMRWRQIKSAFSRAPPRGERISASRARKRGRGIWQRRHWERTTSDDQGYAARFDYIHYNPAKHG